MECRGSKCVSLVQQAAMPRLRRPVPLQAAALRAVGAFVAAAGRAMLMPVCTLTQQDSAGGLAALEAHLQVLNELLYASTPWYLFDSMAQEVLTAVSALIQETKNEFSNFESMVVFMNQMNVVVSLTEVAMHPHLKHIDISLWPKIMRYVLYKKLHRMTGLESLNLGSGSSGWKMSDIEKCIVSGITTMHNLTSLCLCFDCTDYILSLVGENCPRLQKLDVTSSRSITNRSVPSLLQCTKLQELLLYRTSVTLEGYSQLLVGLKTLEDFGRCDEFGQVLEFTKNEFHHSGPFGLRTFQSRDVTTAHLNLLVEMCPRVKHVSIFHDERISDLTVLANLDDLSELKLLSCDFFTDHVKQLLEVKGQNLTWLHLEHVEEIDLNALMYISQYCPNLKKLTLFNCEFLDHTSLSYTKLRVPPFQHLEHIVCLADCALLHLEFLLLNCFNIKFIQLGSSTGIGDETMAKVLLRNPMTKLEELRILYSDNLSMLTVRLLMTHCHSLRVLSELESWQGISERELKDFRNHLARNNIDLDVRPTLSY